MLDALRQEADSMPGELVLGHLCELALDIITQHNVPDGECCFCLGLLVCDHHHADVGGSLRPAYDVTELSCFHCFHSNCFVSWLRWQQNHLCQREAQIIEEYKSMAPFFLKREEVWAEDVSSAIASTGCRLFSVRCPRCRYKVSPTELANTLGSALTRTIIDEESVNRGIGNPDVREWSSDDESAATPSKVLEPEALEQLRVLQCRFAEVLRVQQSCNGLVAENIAISLESMRAAVEGDRDASASRTSETDQSNDGDFSNKNGKTEKILRVHPRSGGRNSLF